MSNLILNTFAILFETNADDARRKIEGAGDAAEAGANNLDAALRDATAAATTLANAMDSAGEVSGLVDATQAAAMLEDALKRMGEADPETLEATLAAIDDELNRAAQSAGDLGQEMAETSRETKAGLTDAAGAARTLDAGLEAATDQTRDLDRATGRVRREIIEAAQATVRLTRELGEATRNAANVGRSFVSNVQGVMNFLGGLYLVNMATQAISSQFKTLVDLTDKASRYNFNVEGLQAYSGVLEDAGGNAQDAERYIKRFADSIATAFGDAASAPAKALKSLGLSAADAKGDLKDTEAVLLDLAGALEGVNRDIAINRLKDLGIIDPAMVKTVLAGRAALMQLMDAERAKGVVTAEGAARARELKMALDDVKDVVAALFNQLVARFGPALVGVTQALIKMSEWFGKNKVLVQGFGVGLAASLAVVAGVLWGSYIPAWIAAAAATLAATWPIIAIIALAVAAAAAFALLWEDVQAFLNGQPSLLGDLIQRYAWVRKAVDAIVAAWRYLADVVPPILQTLGALVSSFFDTIGQANASFREAFARVFGGLWAVVEPVLSVIIEGFRLLAAANTAALGLIWEAVQATFSKWWPFIKPVFDLITQGVEFVGSVFAAVGKAIWGEWSAMFDRFVDRMKILVSWLKALAGLFKSAREGLNSVNTGGPPVPPPERKNDRPAAPRAPAPPRDGARPAARTQQAMAIARTQMATASTSPLNAKSSPALAANRPTSVSRTTSVKIDKVEVHTKATDADGMAKAAGGALSSHLDRAFAETNDGVER